MRQGLSVSTLVTHPHYVHTYRVKHSMGTPRGMLFRELVTINVCFDEVMLLCKYLITCYDGNWHTTMHRNVVTVRLTVLEFNSDGNRNWSQLQSEYSHLLLDTFLTSPCAFLLLCATCLNGFTVFLQTQITLVKSAETNQSCRIQYKCSIAVEHL